MSSKVEVLCPNGHRVNVKTTPNTKILQILEEACTKKGFIPASEYDLKHGRKILDVTLTVRYAGLPNLAKLELVKAAKSRAEVSVVIALQLEDGKRLQHEFPPSTCLWNVLVHWKSEGNDLTVCKEEGTQPVCIYMREEVIGGFALKATSLRDLGLTQGKHILRLIHRPVDEATLQAVREKIESEQARQAKLAAKSAQSQTSIEDKPSTSESVSRNEEPMETGSSEAVADRGVTEGRISSEKPTHNQAAAAQQKKVEGGRPKVAVQTPPQQAQLSPEGQAMAHGFFLSGVFPEPTSADLNRQKQEQRREQQMMRRAAARRPDFPLQDFKFPESTKGKNVYQNEFSEVNKDEYRPCDRETVVFNTDEIESPQVQDGEELPPDFFEVTEADIRNMWASMQKKIAVESEQPLMTQAMRIAQMEDKITKYPRVIIRVNFPDKFVIQGLFRPRETVFALKKFVKEHLEEKSRPFYLYTAPPKCVLKDDAKSLVEADLVPMAVVYFGSETKSDHFLSSAVLAEKQSPSSADQVIVKNMTKSDSAEDQGKNPSTSGQEKRPSSSSSAAGSSAVAGDGATKVPKWFKMGKK